MTDETPNQFPHYIQDPALPDAKMGLDPGIRFNKKGQFVATHHQSKPLMKLMVRALQGRKGKSIFSNKAKRKKVRVL